MAGRPPRRKRCWDSTVSACCMSGWRLRDGAGRYEVGNYNYIGLAALQASLALLQRIQRRSNNVRLPRPSTCAPRC
jgi:hypothetical protein